MTHADVPPPRHCCHPDGCGLPAAFEVRDEDPADAYAGTDSCAEHLGPLVAMTGLPARVTPIASSPVN